jgi:hypothetical protein
MKAINIKQELNFIHSEKTNISNKGDLAFQLLNIGDVLIANYINATEAKMKRFYKVIYLKTKNFYLEQYSC